MIFGREPALVVGLVQAVISLVVLLGLSLPAGTDAAIIAVTTALLALVVRSRVTPVA